MPMLGESIQVLLPISSIFNLVLKIPTIRHLMLTVLMVVFVTSTMPIQKMVV